MAKRGPIQLDAIGVPVDGGRSGGFIGRCFRLVARFQDIKLARSDGIVFLLRPLSVPTTDGAVVWSELPPEEKRPCVFTSIPPSRGTAICWRYSRSWQSCSWLDPGFTTSVKASMCPCKRGSSPGRLPRSRDSMNSGDERPMAGRDAVSNTYLK